MAHGLNRRVLLNIQFCQHLNLKYLVQNKDTFVYFRFLYYYKNNFKEI